MKKSVDTNADKVAQWVKDISKQIPYATMLAMNTLAFQARTNAKKDIEAAFGTPTAFTKSAVQIKTAKKSDRKVVIGIGSGVRTGKKGDPRSSYLAPHINGGLRTQKRIEKSLFRSIPAASGAKMWLPAKGEKLNKFGNMPRARQLAIAKGAVNKGSARHNKKFFTKGKAIYERYGRGLKKIKPVVIFISTAKYQKKWEFYKPVKELYKKEFDRTFHTQWNHLIRKEGLAEKGMIVGTTVSVK